MSNFEEIISGIQKSKTGTKGSEYCPEGALVTEKNAEGKSVVKQTNQNDKHKKILADYYKALLIMSRDKGMHYSAMPGILDEQAQSESAQVMTKKVK